MLPTRLGMASLRQTSRLRRKTGQKRSDRMGARQMPGCSVGFAGVLRVVMASSREMGENDGSCVLPDLASCQFEEKVLQIGGPMQGVQVGLLTQRVQQRGGMVGVEKHRLAAYLHARGQGAQGAIRQRQRA